LIETVYHFLVHAFPGLIGLYLHIEVADIVVFGVEDEFHFAEPGLQLGQLEIVLAAGLCDVGQLKSQTFNEFLQLGYLSLGRERTLHSLPHVHRVLAKFLLQMVNLMV
jgi:hypothetical protein